MVCTGIEMLNGRLKVLELEGWSADVCRDMTKYDPALGKLYRKYWRRSQNASPEMEIAMGLITSLGMFHFKNKVSSRMFGNIGGGESFPKTGGESRRTPRAASPVPSDTDSEGLPP